MSGGNAEGRRRDATIARRDENLGVKNGLKVLSTRSRVYLSVGPLNLASSVPKVGSYLSSWSCPVDLQLWLESWF